MAADFVGFGGGEVALAGDDAADLVDDVAVVVVEVGVAAGGEVDVLAEGGLVGGAVDGFEDVFVGFGFVVALVGGGEGFFFAVAVDDEGGMRDAAHDDVADVGEGDVFVEVDGEDDGVAVVAFGVLVGADAVGGGDGGDPGAFGHFVVEVFHLGAGELAIFFECFFVYGLVNGGAFGYAFDHGASLMMSQVMSSNWSLPV